MVVASIMVLINISRCFLTFFIAKNEEQSKQNNLLESSQVPCSFVFFCFGSTFDSTVNVIIVVLSNQHLTCK